MQQWWFKARSRGAATPFSQVSLQPCRRSSSAGAKWIRTGWVTWDVPSSDSSTESLQFVQEGRPNLIPPVGDNKYRAFRFEE
mmetsp:Transcript_45518/g.81896  ORF Transcript_45518/g.81896 Transcript_45518/m.81896 type:complete len:82 (-) Transcript_45518:125-370(-)